MNSNNISVIIHSFNDEENIVECIESAKLLTSQIIVIDMYSTDKTVEIAKKLGVEIFLFPKSNYVEPAREFGINKAKTEWVFLLDTDERVTPKLASEIKIIIDRHSGDPDFSSGDSRIVVNNNYSGQARVTNTHYKMARKNIFGRVKWLRYGGWWPDYQTRLINKKFFKTWPKQIHSTPVIEGNVGFLTNPIIHYFHGNLETMVKKTIIFEEIESSLLFKADKTVNTFTFFRKFLGELFRRLIKKLGFMDGEIGIIESVYQAFSKTITYIYLYEKRSSL